MLDFSFLLKVKSCKIFEGKPQFYIFESNMFRHKFAKLIELNFKQVQPQILWILKRSLNYLTLELLVVKKFNFNWWTHWTSRRELLLTIFFPVILLYTFYISCQFPVFQAGRVEPVVS